MYGKIIVNSYPVFSGQSAYHLYLLLPYMIYNIADIDEWMAKKLQMSTDEYCRNMQMLGAKKTQCMAFFVPDDPEKSRQMAENAFEWANSILLMNEMKG